MAKNTELKENWKEAKVNIHSAIASLKKCVSDYKVERKSEWKSFKNKFNDDMDNVKKSLKELATLKKNTN